MIPKNYKGFILSYIGNEDFFELMEFEEGELIDSFDFIAKDKLEAIEKAHRILGNEDITIEYFDSLEEE